MCPVKKTIPPLLGAMLALLLVGCSLAYETRPVICVGATGHAPKLDEAKLESLYDDVSSMVLLSGFRESGGPQAAAFQLTGERIYEGGYFMEPNFRCWIRLDHQSAQVSFDEMERPPRSHLFPATDAQRRAVRAIAQQVERYLRKHLPSSYQISVSGGEQRAKN